MNGNVVRRWLGHSHIPEDLAPRANAFLRDIFSPFLNHHRALSLRRFEVEAANGRRRRKYPQNRTTIDASINLHHRTLTRALPPAR